MEISGAAISTAAAPRREADPSAARPPRTEAPPAPAAAPASPAKAVPQAETVAGLAATQVTPGIDAARSVELRSVADTPPRADSDPAGAARGQVSRADETPGSGAETRRPAEDDRAEAGADAATDRDDAARMEARRETERAMEAYDTATAAAAPAASADPVEAALDLTA